MDYDTLKSVNDNLKRFNGKLIQENEALKKQVEALKAEIGLVNKNFHKLSIQVQDLMIKNDALTDKKDAVKSENKELQKSNNYLKSIIETLQREHLPGAKNMEDTVKPPELKKSKLTVLIKDKLKGRSDGKYLNPVYDRLANMLGIFLENSEVNCNTIKEEFRISRATFARDTKILKDMGYIELTNSKKEGMYNITKNGKRLKKEIKKEMKKMSTP